MSCPCPIWLETLVPSIDFSLLEGTLESDEAGGIGHVAVATWGSLVVDYFHSETSSRRNELFLELGIVINLLYPLGSFKGL